ncbi:MULTISPECIES: McrB family protein [Arcobacteraceae]|uniref:AAA family ATPase n=2 Tax=Aliarcobacter thereius TaxID=544718 RepID=A0A5R9H7A3_9BACT|nr:MULTISPECIES: AAA family ATPase [Arcobacteraceae]OCL83412.1 5-methylcytosine-specific restriction enzyme B [Arcobacter porcinus]OCL93753.1 5-methylcytosine-specific restriction enzyme B [Aliarcobacter thereius]OCL95161.1 5-methylcytosine-specific restriction enzyme B [Aliarcobacter thereius LMG 24486]QBF16849.1 McrBC 5-methylcytosine restriction system, component McrB [Aliarcobacter thereius LMG 24486]TLS73316.1 AAA family ATPase [Aliarcobacter thereius]
MKIIPTTEEHTKDLYEKFKSLYGNISNQELKDKIKYEIINENKFQWNQASLDMYINALISMISGNNFTFTINNYSKEYFLNSIKKDFGEEKFRLAEQSLKQHEENRKNKKENKNINTNITFKNNYEKEYDYKEIEISNKIKNLMLYGAPGVGKTHNYKRLISMIENGENEKTIFDAISKNEITNNFDNSIFETIKNEKRVEFVTFHQSYSYEDFIEGFRPQEDGSIKLEDGIFKKICEDANKEKQKNFYIVIDEINRGNISKIFGELITLIEEDKRDDYEVTLPYSKEKFKIPSNLYIIATMNSTDKSIATIDIALRRRFTFLKMKPNLNLVKYENAQKLMEKLNKHISNAISEDYALGHSYFMKIEDENNLEFVKEYKIKPLLEEYFYGDETNYKIAEDILYGRDDK